MITAHVVFATITGNNEDVADIITEALEDQGVTVTQTEISQTEADEFKNVDICIVCPYTYDEGALPEEGMDFFDDLNEVDLTGKVFAVAGSGDVFYNEFYNLAVDKFEQAFLNAHATKGSESVKINLEPDEDDIESLDGLALNTVQKAQSLKA